MAFPLGTRSDIYNMLVKNLGHSPSLSEYNDAVRWINATTPGSNIPLYTEAPTAQPVTTPPPYATGYNPESGWTMTPGQPAVYQGTGTPTTLQPPIVDTGGIPASVMNPALYTFEQQLALQAAADQAALARTQLSVSAQQAAASTSAAAQLEAQRIANQGALERLKGQLAESLSQALMTNDMNRANLTLSVAQLAADPRSSVGFMEYLGHAGGGPTAISQNLAAGMTPSPVWDVMPQTQGPSAETQRWLDMLEGFIGTLAG